MRTLPQRQQRGVALLEALLAALLLAIGLLGTIGLQARAYSALSEAGMRAEATIASERLLGMMATDGQHLSDYQLSAGGEPGTRLAAWLSATRKSIPGAQVVVAVSAGSGAMAQSTVQITIRWQRKADAPTNQHSVRALI